MLLYMFHHVYDVLHVSLSMTMCICGVSPSMWSSYVVYVVVCGMLLHVWGLYVVCIWCLLCVVYLVCICGEYLWYGPGGGSIPVVLCVCGALPVWGSPGGVCALLCVWGLWYMCI